MGVIEIFAGLLTTLVVPIVVIVAIASAVGRARREDPDPSDPGIGTVRRLFLYGLAFVSLGLAASGAALLLGGVLDALFGGLVIADSDTELAVSLSLTVVGLPSWAVFMWLAQRSVQRHAVERRSLARWTYLLLVRGIALAVLVGFGVEVGQALVRIEEFEGGEWGWLLVALLTWGLHQWTAARGGVPSSATRLLDRLYLAFGSVLGLYVLGGGLLTLLIEPGLQAYHQAFRPSLLDASEWSEAVRSGPVLLVVGAGAWWWHWLARLRRDVATPLWHVVVFIFGILAGVAAAVSAGATTLYLVLAWLLGAPEEGAAQHFEDLVPAAAFLLVGVASWAYHRAVLAERAPAEERPSDAERVYRYLVAATGLFALGSGLASTFALAVDALAPATELVRPGDWWQEQFAITLTLVLVGGPLWALYWFAAQREAVARGVEERDALPRRVFLFGIFGVAVLVVLVNLAIVLFQFFDDGLAGTLGAETFRETRWSFALLLTAGAIAGYYWLVLRDDQAATATPEGAPAIASAALRDVVVVAPPEAARRLAEAFIGRGVTVRRWHRTDGDDAGLSDEALQDVIARASALDVSSMVVVVAVDGGVEVIPVRREE